MLAYALVILGVLLRVIPHMPNFSPITGLALFSGVYLKRSQAIWVPISAMIISDAFLAPEPLSTRLTVYGSFCLIGCLGLWLRKRKSIYTIITSSLVGSGIFYLVTNFAFFYPSDMYTHNWQGITASYYNALPFFRNTILGDLFYTGLLFGAYELITYLVKTKNQYAIDKIKS
jgi:hypothetical protein